MAVTCCFKYLHTSKRVPVRERLPAKLVPAGRRPNVREQRGHVGERHVEPAHEVVVHHLKGAAVGGRAVDTGAVAAAEPAGPALADEGRRVLVEGGVELGGGDESLLILRVEVDALCAAVGRPRLLCRYGWVVGAWSERVRPGGTPSRRCWRRRRAASRCGPDRGTSPARCHRGRRSRSCRART